MVVKSPILKKILAVFLLGTAAWLIGSSVKPLLEAVIGTNPLVMIFAGIGLVFLAWLLLGKYIKY